MHIKGTKLVSWFSSQSGLIYPFLPLSVQCMRFWALGQKKRWLSLLVPLLEAAPMWCDKRPPLPRPTQAVPRIQLCFYIKEFWHVFVSRQTHSRSSYVWARRREKLTVERVFTLAFTFTSDMMVLLFLESNFGINRAGKGISKVPLAFSARQSWRQMAVNLSPAICCKKAELLLHRILPSSNSEPIFEMVLVTWLYGAFDLCLAQTFRLLLKQSPSLGI